MPAARTLLTAILLSAAVLAPATAVLAPAAEARTCRAPSGIARLSADGASCRTASAIAARTLAVRRSTTRYAAATRCRGDFCIVVSGWRCRPMRSPKPKERCTRRRASITWLVRS